MFIPLFTRLSTFWVVRRISKPTLANCHPNSDFDEFLEFFPILAVVVMVVRSGVLLLVMLLMVLLLLTVLVVVTSTSVAKKNPSTESSMDLGET